MPKINVVTNGRIEGNTLILEYKEIEYMEPIKFTSVPGPRQWRDGIQLSSDNISNIDDKISRALDLRAHIGT